MLNWNLWNQVFMTDPDGVIVVIDPQVGERRGQLRALPLFVELGLEKFTFTTSWRSFELVPYTHRVIYDQVEPRDLVDEFPIVQFIAQNTEDLSQSDATRKLLMAQRARDDNPLLIYVFDSEQFVLRQSTGSKGFIDEYELKQVFGYERLFFRFCEATGLPTRQLSTTHSLNFMLHRLAWELGDEHLLTRLSDLFNYTRLPPESWGWDLLERVAAIEGVRCDDRAIAQMLRPWIDSDISKVVTRLLENIQRFDYDADRVSQYRKQLVIERREGNQNATN